MARKPHPYIKNINFTPDVPVKQTRKAQQEEWKALAEVRGAIKGWAFTHQLAAYLAHGQQAVDRLPAQWREAGEAELQPLRDALARQAK
jgi:hypothetical protein